VTPEPPRRSGPPELRDPSVHAGGPFRVALTFDAEHPDRPTETGVHAAIVEQLTRLDVRATFFVQGRWTEACPDLARALPAAGHLVGSHSFYHARMPLLSRAGFAADVRAAERVIREIVGVDPRPWFRLPFGAGSGRPAIHDRLAELGYRHVPWDVDGRDWDPGASPRRVEGALVRGTLAHGDGAIVLLHSWPRTTLAVLDPLVSRLRDAGATFVTLDELEQG
jgi:peptidoglycan/xylan/chitin deacetylase (PgdA/CDA1 family)